MTLNLPPETHAELCREVDERDADQILMLARTTTSRMLPTHEFFTSAAVRERDEMIEEAM